MVSCNEDQKALVDALRKKGTKRLIDICSPMHKHKKKLFQELVANKDNTRVIIKISIEIDSSINYTHTHKSYE